MKGPPAVLITEGVPPLECPHVGTLKLAYRVCIRWEMGTIYYCVVLVQCLHVHVHHHPYARSNHLCPLLVAVRRPRPLILEYTSGGRGPPGPGHYMSHVCIKLMGNIHW